MNTGLTQVQLQQLALYLSQHQQHFNILLFILPAIAVLIDSCIVITVGMHLKSIARKAVNDAATDMKATMMNDFPILTQLPDILQSETITSLNELAQHTRGFRSAIGKALAMFDRDEPTIGKVTFIKSKDA